MKRVIVEIIQTSMLCNLDPTKLVIIFTQNKLYGRNGKQAS
jgi:hypothetical protein